jgi:hypothetical protein
MFSSKKPRYNAKTKISKSPLFTEEGATVKSGSVFAGFGAGSAGHGSYGYEANLN